MSNTQSSDDQARILFRSKPRVTLGSASYSRKALLLELSQEYGFDFDIMTAEIDERSLGDRTKNPEQLVLQLASTVVEELISEGAIFRCAGGLMIEHPLVEPLITSIQGTKDSVMGLSKKLVLEGLLAVTRD
ncbi:hypothetical protein WJX75_006979 [Coccomyxa subellipsoidea]|uniref:Maf-like protein n=1 Tax=Coccomyxa subellipsoidea TaxID=248742 RepID=A0ABR2YYR8_9CHLO